MVKAKYWEKLDGKKVKCTLCPHSCVIPEGGKGICNIRENIDGELIAAGYGRTTSLAMDPIEKKPLFHFKPGSLILSVAPNGCNLKCRWCQNWQISQEVVPTRFIDPKLLVDIAIRENSVGIAFTYTEPLIWFEYIIDVAKIGKPKGLSMVAVTNGYINPESLNELLDYIDAMNIDLKAMDDEVYRKLIGGRLEPVLNTVRTSAKRILIEVTNLLIPGVNDSDDQIKRLVDFIADVDPKIPVHFSRYFPAWEFNAPPTPVKTLLRAREIASEKLDYVYLGNVYIPDAEDTFCPYCGNKLVSRSGFYAKTVGITEDGKCSKCGKDVDIVL